MARQAGRGDPLRQVSVAMATYNGARFLPEQLASLAGQTLPPAELVVSDDGSTDGTIDVIRAFAATAPFPVRILDKDRRLGFADNFMFAAENCTAALIAFCDQDDVWLPAKLQTGAERLAADGSLLSMHRLTLTDGALNPVGVWAQEIRGNEVHEPLSLDPYMTGWGNTMLFRRELVHLIPRERRPRQPEEERPLSHDTWVYVLAAALGRVSHIDEPLILYRQHTGNAIGTQMPSHRVRLAGKLDAFRAVPMTIHRERLAFNTVMAEQLRDLAARSEPDRAAAARAADRIELRSRLLHHRVAIHGAPGFAARLAAFSAMARDRSVAPARTSRFSMAKDFLLGVAGFGRHR